MSRLDALAERLDQGIANPDAVAMVKWPPPLDFTTLASRELERLVFLLDHWLPAGYATLFAGHGGAGKSAIALRLAVCIALGIPFYGVNVERRRVLYLSCEDRTSRLHHQLLRICDHLGVDLPELAGSLDVLDLVGRDTILWERNPFTGATETPAFGALREHLARHPADLLIVDGISDTFGGNENARTDAKRYINSLLSLVSESDGAVLLVGHVAKPAASMSAPGREGYSGSTGWHNAVRARWYLYPESRDAGDGDSERTGDLILELQKSNLGPSDQRMRFQWDDEAGLFIGQSITPATSLDRSARDRRERNGILSALAAIVETGSYCPAAKSGSRTAYHVLSEHPAFPETLRGQPADRRRFWRHVEHLRAIGSIIEDSIRRADRHSTATLVPSASSGGTCGTAGHE